jgi:hypothetical protein
MEFWKGRLCRALVPGLRLWLLSFCLVALADPVDLTETWSSGGLAGWTGGGSGVTLTNDAARLRLNFVEQSFVSAAVGSARYALPANTQVTNLSFRLLVGPIPPSSVSVFLRSYAGDEWYVPLAIPASNAETTYSIPLDFSAGWTVGPRATAALLSNDLSSVTAVGVYVIREASARAQWVALDDFRVQGLQPALGLSIVGSVSYAGQQTGNFLVGAAPTGGSATGATAVVGVPGPYDITGLQGLTDYQVSAFRDSNGNGVMDFWEARGAYGTVRLDGVSVGSVAFALSDPMSADGIPLWWLKLYFDIPDPQANGESALGEVDSDGDGMVNYAEYRAGTEPTNAASVLKADVELRSGTPAPVVRWGSVAGRSYSLLSADAVGQVFTVRQSGISANVPTNAFTDTAATNAVRRFYRVLVE